MQGIINVRRAMCLEKNGNEQNFKKVFPFDIKFVGLHLKRGLLACKDAKTQKSFLIWSPCFQQGRNGK